MIRQMTGAEPSKCFKENELVAISMLQHYFYCKRRAALVLLERIWDDNLFTVTGTHLHKKVDSVAKSETVSSKVKIIRSLPVRSLKLGISGYLDVLEVHNSEPSARPCPDNLSNAILYPVEYKRGKKREEKGYMAQLCAQAFCLEEMLNVCIPRGAIFFGETRRRLEVDFDKALREETQTAIGELHSMVASGITPTADLSPKCDKCSLKNKCYPQMFTTQLSPTQYLDQETKKDSKS
jgi:CRISPR-associated exonuclease Cas4